MENLRKGVKIMAKNFCDLTGKYAVIFGGAGGIGQAIAEAFTQAGAAVMIISRSEKSLQRAAGEIRANTGEKVLYTACDATDEAQVEAALKTVLDAFGTIDILVNSQGYNRRYPGAEFPADEWDKLFDTNVKSFMLTCKHFGKYMKDNKIKGKIINLSSVRGQRANADGGNGTVGYCSTKGAVEMLTRCYASEYGPDIQVNAIGPTLVYTPMMAGVMPEDAETRNRIFAGTMPAKRIADVEDIKGPAVFLASPASDFVTGSTIFVDGGLIAVG